MLTKSPNRQTVSRADKRVSEQEISRQVRDTLARELSPEYAVHAGKSILYKIEVNAFGKVTPDSVDSPVRGQYAFQTDILVETQRESIPLVVVELKYGSFTTHDVITYSSKATRHKEIYPYLRYGFVVVGLDALGRRFLTHNHGFNFAMALRDVASRESDLIAVVKRQVANADRMRRLMQSSRIALARYEETIDITD